MNGANTKYNRILLVSDVVATVESVKAVAEVYMPISGNIVTVNESLTEEPALINSSPYEKGWATQCRLYQTSEFVRLSSFLVL